MGLDQYPHPLIFAHRGASAYAPENTLAAFELALQQGAPAIELDVKLSADGHVVVIHDQTVDRTTQHSGRVNELTLEELRQMDAGSHFDISFHGEKIPTLAEVFETIDPSVLINVELTNYASPGDDLPHRVAELIKRHNIQHNLLFSSFNPIALLRIHRLVSQAPIGLLALSGPAGAWARSRLGRLIPYRSLHPEWHDLSPSLIRTAHRRKRKVYAYTVNQEESMHHSFDLGIDGIFTDDPVLAQKVLKARDAQNPASQSASRNLPENSSKA
jgi:glycerophosphoryl diester phosphodiesterase